MVEVGKEPEMPEPVRHVEVAEEAIQLQPDAPAEEIPTENSESASAEDLPPLDDAVESFRRQASKASKKKDEQVNG
jgi:ribosomal protein L14E/L6E/L27E